METAKISKYIKELVDDKILIRRSSFSSKKDIRYEIFDPMVAFYYRFIRENSEMIRNGYGKLIKKDLMNSINEFIEHRYEKTCLTYLEEEVKKGNVNGLFLEFENFEYYSKKLKRSVEIDIISSYNDKLLVAETKFSKRKRTIRDYNDMKEDLTSELFSSYKKENIELYLFGANGFDEKITNIKDNNLHLIDLEIMFK